MNLLNTIQQRFHEALTPLTADPTPYVAMIKPAQDAKHGDYQANCAMSLAKTLGKKPRDVAQEIVDRLPLGDMLEKPDIAGPGFINLRLANAWLNERLRDMARDDRLGVSRAQPAKKYVIDFSGPNVAKPMHVGHLRSTIIGDTLARQLRFLGHSVIGDNHLGDWGTQFGIMLHGYKNYRNEKAFAENPIQELVRLYVMIREIAKPGERKQGEPDEESEAGEGPRKFTDEAMQIGRMMADAYRNETAKLHKGDQVNLALWKMVMTYCMGEIDPIYRRLDIKFDQTLGESFYQPMLAGIVDELLSRGIAEESQGAVVINFGDKEPPSLIRKKDGAFTYTTSDLATIKYRVEHFHADAMLYVVDFRQGLHFKNLFDAARRWGFDRVEMTHVSYGSVLGKDGKPIKTREGGSTTLESLLDEAVKRAAEVYEQGINQALELGDEADQSPERERRDSDEAADLSEVEKRQIYEAIGIGAVKYADLSQNRTSDYKFDFDKMLAMNGNTATYMQYAYARNRSIFRRGGENVDRFRSQPPLPVLDTPQERALALQLLRLEEYLSAAASEYQPNLITSYLWDLAKTYSGFFQNCPVLKAPTPALRESRLLLCDLTARVLRLCLELLGIRTVERM